MNILRTLLSWISQEPATPNCRSIKKTGRHERGLRHLIAHGEITLADIGGNNPGKIAHRYRVQGYLIPHGAPNAERWATNERTGCDYKVYKWTGKLPASWVKTEGYTGKDRRSKVRGGCL